MGELIYRLSNPGYTVYHRAALGGLAATMKALALEDGMPEGLSAEVTSDTVRIWWSEELPDRDAVARLLASSFRLTKDKMIDLPRPGNPVEQGRSATRDPQRAVRILPSTPEDAARREGRPQHRPAKCRR